MFQKLYALANPQHSALADFLGLVWDGHVLVTACYYSDTAFINIRHRQKALLPNEDAALQSCPTELMGRDIFGFVGSWERCVAVVPLLVFARAPWIARDQSEPMADQSQLWDVQRSIGLLDAVLMNTTSVIH